MKIEAGQLAPDFTLYDSDKNKNVLLLFFPFAFTGTCTAELCSVRDNISVYNDANAKVFGISVDSIHSLAKYKEQQQLNFSLLSDFNKDVSSAYGCLYDVFSYGMKGVSKRSAFVIDKNGIIRYIAVLENATEIPNFLAIQDTLKSLK